MTGVSDMRWSGSGQCCVAEHIVDYAGNDDPHHMNSIAVLSLTDRVILVTLQGRPVNTNIIQVYAPTADKPGEVV